MSIGENIKRVRKAKGFTQAKLAAKMGIPYQQISQYERGLVEPKFKTVCKIADALNACITDFYDDSEISAMSEEKTDKVIEHDYSVMEKEIADLKEHIMIIEDIIGADKENNKSLFTPEFIELCKIARKSDPLDLMYVTALLKHLYRREHNTQQNEDTQDHTEND